MTELTGTLNRVDLGMGAWVVTLTTGERVQLVGPIPVALEGMEVDVTGDDAQAWGFAMTGARVVRVASIAARQR